MPNNITPEKFYLYQDVLTTKLASQSVLVEVAQSSRVLITSVHGVDHLREGKTKLKDSGSLNFAYLLSQFAGTNFYGLNEPNILDNNYYHQTPQKEFLTDFVKINNIQLVLDIHTCHAVRPYDVEIGTMDGKTLLGYDCLEKELLEMINRHFFCISNQVFKGEGSNGSETMVNFFANKLGIPSLQIEINSAILKEDSLSMLHQRSKLLHCFCEFLKEQKI